MQNIHHLIKQRVLILDGAMGTMIQQKSLTENDFRGNRFATLPGIQKGNNELLTLTRPDIILDIHRRYLSAGADIIETNTFSAQRISMADYHCEHLCAEVNAEAVRLARCAANEFSTPDKPRFVAGSIGPTNKTCSMSADVGDPAARSITFDELYSAYYEQAKTLIESGVDLLLIETIFDTLNAKAAIAAACDAMEQSRSLPLMLSMTIADAGGHTLSGQTINAFLTSVAHAPLFSVGLNCSFGAKEMLPFLRELSRNAPWYVSAYPNAGLPNSFGGYDQTPQQMAEEVEQYIKEGLVNIIGGCCGTTDEYIAEYATLVKKNGHLVTPRRIVAQEPLLKLAGLDQLELRPESDMICIGERCNVAGSRKFLRLIKEGNYDEAVDLARKQVEQGAQIIDINMDDALLSARDEMVHFLRLLCAEPEIARIPFMIDSSEWEVIIEALKCIQGKCVVNSISLKEGEETFLKHARDLRRYGAAVVVMAFDERGQADTYERRITICERAYRLLTEQIGFPPTDIIFDPNVLAICTGIPEHNHYATDFIRATQWIRTHLPHSHVSGGVSNLSFAFRGNNYLREAMHSVFLHLATTAGMDLAIVNPSSHLHYADIPLELRSLLEAVILGNEAAVERLILLAPSIAPTEKSPSSATQQPKSCCTASSAEERIQHALITGQDSDIEADILEALPHFPHAINLIEGPLMEAMNIVGERFSTNKMFLPQVVKTARTMKKAVAILKPYIEREKQAQQSAGRALIATVKGDVHDIGKNIVSVILSCNNYEVIDLGVMCPAEDILERTKELHPDFIGLSGLITPSLDEMITTAKLLQSANIQTPIIIGGATTNALHTALRIAPVYDGPVVWVKDAAQLPSVAASLTHPKLRDTFIENLKIEQEALRANYHNEHQRIHTLNAARDAKLNLFNQK